jgi:RNA polymerase sigma factor (sigma-70 family)
MEFTSFQERIERQFDAFCKAVIQNKARSIHQAISKQAAREIEFSAMAELQLNSLSHEDEYFSQQFKVLDFEINVQDELMAEALATLSEDRRRIILLYYFLGMNDREIGEILHLIRETVQYRRTSSLKQLKQILEGKGHEKKD